LGILGDIILTAANGGVFAAGGVLLTATND
jgi:hypothetical protein